MGKAWTAHDTSNPSLLDTWFCLDRKHVFFDCGQFRILIENGVFHVVTNWNDKLFKCMNMMEIHTAKEETGKKALNVIKLWKIVKYLINPNTSNEIGIKNIRLNMNLKNK